MSTLVSVGNATQPFVRLLEAVARIAAELPQPVIIQYGAATGFQAPLCQCIDYLSMEEFEHRVAAAELLILHAGAGSVLHAVRAGKVPVVVPRFAHLHEHVDDHQQEFARELGQSGKVVVCRETADLLSSTLDALQQQKNTALSGTQPPLVAVISNLLREHANTLASSRKQS